MARGDSSGSEGRKFPDREVEALFPYMEMLLNADPLDRDGFEHPVVIFEDINDHDELNFLKLGRLLREKGFDCTVHADKTSAGPPRVTFEIGGDFYATFSACHWGDKAEKGEHIYHLLAQLGYRHLCDSYDYYCGLPGMPIDKDALPDGSDLEYPQGVQKLQKEVELLLPFMESLFIYGSSPRYVFVTADGGSVVRIPEILQEDPEGYKKMVAFLDECLGSFYKVSMSISPSGDIMVAADKGFTERYFGKTRKTTEKVLDVLGVSGKFSQVIKEYSRKKKERPSAPTGMTELFFEETPEVLAALAIQSLLVESIQKSEGDSGINIITKDNIVECLMNIGKTEDHLHQSEQMAGYPPGIRKAAAKAKKEAIAKIRETINEGVLDWQKVGEELERLETIADCDEMPALSAGLKRAKEVALEIAGPGKNTKSVDSAEHQKGKKGTGQPPKPNL